MRKRHTRSAPNYLEYGRGDHDAKTSHVWGPEQPFPCLDCVLRFFSAFAVLFLSFWAVFHILLPRWSHQDEMPHKFVSILIHKNAAYTGKKCILSEICSNFRCDSLS